MLHCKHDTGGSPEGIADLSPEEAVVKLQRQNLRLRRKAESALALEQENAQLKTQLEDIATQMVHTHDCACTQSLSQLHAGSE